jgi:hypothetical protein
LRLANLPGFALDRLRRYEATLWRQVRQILFALDALDRRKPQDRKRRFHFGSRQELPVCEREIGVGMGPLIGTQMGPLDRRVLAVALALSELVGVARRRKRGLFEDHHGF